MVRQCRCHGVSGSCAVRTCWKSMPDFRKIGQFLKDKYENAVQVAPRSRKKLRRRERVRRKMPIDKDTLVHIHSSPNYCRRDEKRGIPGTKGRECNRSSRSQDSCNLLCCGRGYNTQVVKKVERCHCKFVWCCYVKCKSCESIVDRHTCKWGRNSGTRLKWLTADLPTSPRQWYSTVTCRRAVDVEGIQCWAGERVIQKL